MEKETQGDGSIPQHDQPPHQPSIHDDARITTAGTGPIAQESSKLSPRQDPTPRPDRPAVEPIGKTLLNGSQGVLQIPMRRFVPGACQPQDLLLLLPLLALVLAARTVELRGTHPDQHQL